MDRLMYARFIRFRNDWKKIVVWLILPILLTVLVMEVIKEVADDIRIPIALVLEEDTKTAKELVSNVESVSLINVERLSLAEAKQRLLTHEVDSFYVIHKGYEKNIEQERYNNLVTAYESNMSFAYPVTTEIIHSYIIQDASRAKAAIKVKDLYKTYDDIKNWDATAIVERSKERQASADLLTSTFAFFQKKISEKDEQIFFIRSWGIWALFTIVVTFFMFDWVLVETASSIKVRWLFTNRNFTYYALVSMMVYTVILFIFDLFALYLFVKLYDEQMSAMFLLTMFLFRFVINIIAFVIALIMKSKMMYYGLGVLISLFFSILGGAIIPIDGLIDRWSYLKHFSPVYQLLAGKVSIWWPVLTVIMLLFLLRRDRDYIVNSK